LDRSKNWKIPKWYRGGADDDADDDDDGGDGDGDGDNKVKLAYGKPNITC
jgi:hypothetical protein